MFKPHDVRGRFGREVTPGAFEALGRATAQVLGTRALTGRDYREHHDELEAAFCAGFTAAGGSIQTRLGVVPSPVISHSNAGLGVMFTASHNPAGFVGAKFFSGREFASEGKIREMESAYEKLVLREGRDFAPLPPTADAGEYISAYKEELPPISDGLFDLAGGAVCAVKELFPRRLFDAPDPTFTLHSAEPKDETLSLLKEESVHQDLIGYAFDGDGDRLLAVDDGKVIEGHVVACFLASKTLAKGEKVVLSIDCASEAFTWLSDQGFSPVYSKVGDVNMIEKAIEVGAGLGAERSGHYTFPLEYPYPDGIRAAAMLAAHAQPGELHALSKEFKNVTVIEAVHFKADFKKLTELARTAKGVEEVVTLDGVKAVFPDYSLLIRASNTEPKIRLNSEAETKELAEKGMALAKEWVAECRKE